MTKELMDNILKDVFVITFDNSNKNNFREVIKDIEKYYDESSYIYYSFSNDGILLVCDKRFDFYIDVLKKAIDSKDKILLDYIICSINGESREDIRKHFKSNKEIADKVIRDDLETLDKEEKDISSKTMNDDIAKKIVKEELENRISDCELIINYVTDVKKSILNRQFKDELDKFIWHHHPVMKTAYYADKLATFNHIIHDKIIISNDNPMIMKDAERYCNVIIKERADERYKYIGILSSNAKIRYLL